MKHRMLCESAQGSSGKARTIAAMSELALALLGAAVAVALFLGIRQGQGLLQRWAATQRLGEARALVAGAFVQPDGRAVGVSWG
jgi:hypothetical protein